MAMARHGDFDEKFDDHVLCGHFFPCLAMPDLDDGHMLHDTSLSWGTVE